MSEKIVEMGKVQQDLEQQVAERDRTIERLNVRRIVDLDRLSEISRARDVLERRGAAQMAKVNAARIGQAAAEEKAEHLSKELKARLTDLDFVHAKLASAECEGRAKSGTHDSGSNTSNAAAMVKAAIASRPSDQGLFSGRRARGHGSRFAERSAEAHRDGRLDEAQLLMESALYFAPTSANWTQFAHVLRERQEFVAAIDAYDAAMELSSREGETVFLRGYCAEMAGLSDVARDDYREALSLTHDLQAKYDHLVGFEIRLER